MTDNCDEKKKITICTYNDGSFTKVGKVKTLVNGKIVKDENLSRNANAPNTVEIGANADNKEVTLVLDLEMTKKVKCTFRYTFGVPDDVTVTIGEK